MTTKKDIVLFGIQGAGKGTQGQLLIEKFGLSCFETGGALREIRTQDTPLGNTVRDIMDRGDLVTNEIVMKIIEEFLESQDGGRVLFDGIPRSMEQKETFDALLKEKGRDIQGIFLTIPREEAIKRMLERGREDDTPEVINRRLENYEAQTLPVIESYKAEGKMVEINGIGSIEEIFERIVSAIES